MSDPMFNVLMENVEAISEKQTESNRFLGISDSEDGSENEEQQNIYASLTDMHDKLDCINTLLGIGEGEDIGGSDPANVLAAIATLQNKQETTSQEMSSVNENIQTTITFQHIGLGGIALNFVILVAIFISLLRNARIIRKMSNELRAELHDVTKSLATQEEMMVLFDRMTKNINAKLSENCRSIQLHTAQAAAVNGSRKISNTSQVSGEKNIEPTSQPLPPENKTFRDVVDALRAKQFPLQVLRFSQYDSVNKQDAGFDGDTTMSSRFFLIRVQKGSMCPCFTVPKDSDTVYLYPNDSKNLIAGSWLTEYYNFDNDPNNWTPAVCRWENQKLSLIRKGIMPNL